jgi:hypothetical protein
MKKILTILCLIGLSWGIAATQATAVELNLHDSDVSYLANSFPGDIQAQPVSNDRLLAMDGSSSASPGGGTAPGGGTTPGSGTNPNRGTSPGGYSDIGPDRTSPGQNTPNGNNSDTTNPDRTSPSGNAPNGSNPDTANPDRTSPSRTNPGNNPSTY